MVNKARIFGGFGNIIIVEYPSWKHSHKLYTREEAIIFTRAFNIIDFIFIIIVLKLVVLLFCYAYLIIRMVEYFVL